MTRTVHSFAIIGEQDANVSLAKDWVSEDSVFSRTADRVVVEFERAAGSPEEAVESALSDMRRCGYRIIRIDF